MCGRYTVLTEDEIIEIREILKNMSLRIVKDELDFNSDQGVEVFPADKSPVLTKCGAGVAIENLKWGFRKWNSTGVIINARAETIENKPLFSKYLGNGRCVIPAGEFFEWDRASSGKRKYYAKDKEGNLLFMAGLYRNVKDETSPDGYTREFVIITKESTGEIARIHDRMPVILRVDQIEPWLTGEMTPNDIVKLEYDVSVFPCDNTSHEE